MPESICLEHITIVLSKPRYPENIGAAARAMCNMGIKQLIIVEPERCELDKVHRLATHAAKSVVDQMIIASSIKEALSPFHHVVGTTARLGGERKIFSRPKTLVEKLIPLSKENHIAILFGPEDRGLSNEDIRLCHALVNIPTDQFSSLNLAQAVMVMCYEIYQATLPGVSEFTPRLAKRHELDGMFEQVKDILVKINYIQPENPDYWMNKLRHFFSRMELRAGEVSILRGICRQINWYAGKCYKDGQAGKPFTDE